MCYMPITIKDPRNPRHGASVPCGHCLECKRALQNAWAIRMYEELKSVDFKGVFFTLTYNDDAVPCNKFEDGVISRSESGYNYKDLLPYETDKPIVRIWNDLDAEGKKEFNADHDGCPPQGDECVIMYSVRKKDIQDWIKRARYKLGDKKITYFVTSEYGPTTQRPHYHGCLFGITRFEAEKAGIFQDWRDRYGFVKIDDIDPSKGGIQYCAKYCSKGVYEHPFCSKDFFYWKHDQNLIIDDVLDDEGNVRLKFTEYHSKHYERCLQYFGIDEPICDPSFRLMSKSLGSSFLKDDAEQVFRQFGAHELQYEERPLALSKDEENVTDQVTETFENYKDMIGFGNKYGRYNYGDTDDFVASLEQCGNYKIILCKKGEDIGDFSKLGDIYIQISLREEIERMIKNNKYYFKNYGDNEKKGKTQNFGFAMPRYYYQKMFGQGLRDTMSAIVLQDNDRVYQEEFEQIRAEDPTREDIEILLSMERAKEEQKRERVKRAFSRAQKQYGKSKI